MSGYVYNLGNELAIDAGVGRYRYGCAVGDETFAMLDAFRANENGGAITACRA